MDKQERIAALYCRFSKEEGDNGSNSIVNQKLLLENYANENNFSRFEVYSDDGFTGTNDDRPDFQRMKQDIVNGIVGTVIVKDMSRLGRNYVMVGQLTDEFFVEHETRLIAVSDGIDTSVKQDDFAPYRNIMNEWYAKDISNKTRTALYARGRAGKKMICKPIYGYKMSDVGEWIIDEEVSGNVERIFTLYLSGTSYNSIAKQFTIDGIPTPTQYSLNDYTYHIDWSRSTVQDILSRREYCGDTVNFKTVKQSYKMKKRSKRPVSENLIFCDTHPAIIDRDTFCKVQAMMQKKKRHSSTPETVSMFRGLLKCSSCGHALHSSSRKTKRGIYHTYICSSYRKHYHKCTSHYITDNDLISAVSEELRKVVNTYRDGSLEQAISCGILKEVSERKILAERTLIEKKTRVSEIDEIIKELYEDKYRGNIPNDVFLKLFAEFKSEQDKLNKEIYQLSQKEGDTKSIFAEINRFINVIKKYSDNSETIQSLTRENLLELIDCIVVGDRVTESDKPREIDIYFNHVGLIKKLYP